MQRPLLVHGPTRSQRGPTLMHNLPASISKSFCTRCQKWTDHFRPHCWKISHKRTDQAYRGPHK